MVRALIGSQQYRCYIGQVGATRFLVDRTLVEAIVPLYQVIYCVHVYDWQGTEEHLSRRLAESDILPIPTGTVQVESRHVNPCAGNDDMKGCSNNRYWKCSNGERQHY